jgi:hypothetical protein
MRRTAFALIAAGLVLAACADNKTPPPRQGYDAGGLPQLRCAPNLDGKIEAKELEPATGVAVKFLVSPPGKGRTVDLVGADRGGKFVWDLGADYADDQLATIQAGEMSEKWYLAAFPSATFAAPIDVAGNLEGAYAYSQGGILLLGLASRDPDGPGGKTLLVYDPPIAIYRFPLEVGKSWISTGTVTNGTLRGQPYAGKDTYEVKVDGQGEAILPDYTFSQVLRVRTTVTVSPSAGAPLVRRQTSFLYECFGEVARATSQDGETNDDFTNAAELRRLGL